MRQGFLTLYLVCGSDGPVAGGSPTTVAFVLIAAFFVALGWKFARGEGSWEVAE